MTATEIREQLLTDDEFLFAEFTRLQWFYGLKHEIRYHEKRENYLGGDSVAEHIYAMFVLFHYFWPLEDPEQKWDKAKMLSMATWHDADELVTGDTMGYLKTAEHREAEIAALPIIKANLPEVMRAETMSSISEYDERQSPEAKFVRALDKIEPLFHLYNADGKAHLLRHGTTYEQNERIKLPFVKDFPIIMRFYQVISDRMDTEGFFSKP
jgi:5'-deoxynucleotidase YfbR-like HD superfamily hydrolase